ncbi:MAG: DUF4157 domain-containing protein [Marinifilaceae bacterium]
MLQLKTLSSKKHQPSLLQPKLEIGCPNDKYEKEADAVADRVMRMSNGDSLRMQPIDAEEAIQMKPALQLSPDGKQFASEAMGQRLSSTKGTGKALPQGLGNEMGNRIGADFGKVKIHTDARAVQMNREVGAQAFTHGNDIYFNSGKYDPGSSKGRHLLAHELTHVVQQGKGQSTSIQRVCGRKHDRTVSGFPKTYIKHIDVDVTNPAKVTLTWTGPQAGKQGVGPFPATIGRGLGKNNCNNTKESNRSGSNCTPKGNFVIERQACALGKYPKAKNASYFQTSRGIAFHYWPYRPGCPNSHGCVRLGMKHSEIIYDNCISKATEKRHGKSATTVHVGGTWKACGSK